MYEKTDDCLFAEERKQLIIEAVNEYEKTTVTDLCERFSVSPGTIRNDLRELEEGGFLKRTHGGAISIKKVTYEPNTYEKEVERVREKVAIARVAATIVQPGDSIALDTGTTTFELAKLIANVPDLTIVTNDLQIASYLEEHSEAVVLITGGRIRKNFHCTLGQSVLDMIQNINVDKLFLATNGMSIAKGLSSPNLDTANVKSALIKSASQVILVADSDKIEKNYFVRFAMLNELDMLITDSGADREFLDAVEKARVEVRVAECECQ
ncbi:MAG: DeoR/GlpR family DNA-binding transcription regulator [Planctomycetia bacterium]|nr:DeoR/GlpR family DNA-binding transcription regulator [Planctomycetia bacterium]